MSAACSEQLFKQQQAVARDYRADPSMAAACKAEADKLCKDVKPGGGRVQACLVRSGSMRAD